MDAAALAAQSLADPDCGWGVGTFGAIAEFVRDRGEPVRLDARSAVTARGGIAVSLAPGVRAVAWERPTSRGEWQHGVSFCLPADAAAMPAHRAVTPLGPDLDALREEDRESPAFDLGLGAVQCGIRLRVSDPAAARALAGAAGRSPFEGSLLRDLAAMQPHRVFISRVARVEVYGAIPPPDGSTPQGPHTHVLPELLRLGRTHPANVPLPAGWVPVLELFPPSPLYDAGGCRVPFDADRHRAFQRLLDAFGDRAAVAAKRGIEAAVMRGAAPEDDPGFDRARRLARRVALRQLACTGAPAAALAAWRARFDPAAPPREPTRFCG